MFYVNRFLWPLRLGWLLACCLYKDIYLQIVKRVSFWLHGCCGEWKGWACKLGKPHQLGGRSYSNWPSLVSPQALCNRTFCGVVCIVTMPFWHFCWCRDFCVRTESDLFLFLYFLYLLCIMANVIGHIFFSYQLFCIQVCRNKNHMLSQNIVLFLHSRQFFHWKWPSHACL